MPDVIRVVATEPDALAAVDYEIHDWFFDLDDVSLDGERQQLTVPFRRWASEEATPVPAHRSFSVRASLRAIMGGQEWQAPWYRWFLRVGEATGYEIFDEDELGGADFNSVTYDETRRRLTIHGNPPVTIRVAVRQLNVSVEETAERLGLARYTTCSVGESYTGNVFPLS